MRVRHLGGKFSVAQGLLVIAACGFVTAAQAAVMHGDFGTPADEVMYLDVTESSGTDPVPPPLFGMPELRDDNQLDFDPKGFVSTTTGGPLDITDGQLNFTLMTDGVFAITEIVIEEAGDYTFAGLGGLGTTATAGLSIWIEVLEIDGEAVTEPTIINLSNSFTTNMSGGPVTLAPWTLGLVVDLEFEIGRPFDFGVTKAEVVIDNQLITNSEQDSLAFIAKKDFKITPFVVIPEPASLIVLAMAGLLLRRR